MGLFSRKRQELPTSAFAELISEMVSWEPPAGIVEDAVDESEVGGSYDLLPSLPHLKYEWIVLDSFMVSWATQRWFDNLEDSSLFEEILDIFYAIVEKRLLDNSYNPTTDTDDLTAEALAQQITKRLERYYAAMAEDHPSGPVWTIGKAFVSFFPGSWRSYSRSLLFPAGIWAVNKAKGTKLFLKKEMKRYQVVR